jgi:saccharopine dehydrogenase-like NADP-dependent oxidoreductase
MIRVIKQKKNLVDISYMPEDALYLDSLAKEHGVTVVMDCGVAPGMPNYIVGYHNNTMKIDEVDYLVGGLPRIREWPFEYKAPFSPADVIEVYTRPARYVENFNLIVKPAMSDAQYIHFDGIGTLEAFNTDGLRSLIITMKHIPFMKEKTLRYPGHIQLIRALQAAGFFNKESVMVNGLQVIPLDFTSTLLFRDWKLGPEEPELTVMRISLKGIKKGERKEIIYELYDEYDPVEKISSMARTTGFTATGTAEMILNKTFAEIGVFPPELVGSHTGCFEFIMNYLRERNVRYNILEKEM